jgi:hypothetical protein
MAGDYDGNHRYLIEKPCAANPRSLTDDKHQGIGKCHPKALGIEGRYRNRRSGSAGLRTVRSNFQDSLESHRTPLIVAEDTLVGTASSSDLDSEQSIAAMLPKLRCHREQPSASATPIGWCADEV